MNGLISLENLSLRPVSEEILALNEISQSYGLVLTEEDAKELSEMRNKAIVENERVEIGVGAVSDIIKRFCTSRYITNENYTYVLNEVTYLFYYIKTETDDKISDHDLIEELFNRFELYCRGSIDTLESREAERIIRKVNSGDKYYEWFKDRDELDYNNEVGSREAEGVYEDSATPHTARSLKFSSYDEDFFADDTLADHDMYEEDLDYNADDFDVSLDAYDEFHNNEKIDDMLDDEKRDIAKEDMDDEEDDEYEQ